MKKWCMALVALGVLAFANVWGQIQGDGGVPRSNAEMLSTVTQTHFEKPNVKALLQEDALRSGKGDGPWRFGYNYSTELTMENSGSWIDLENGGRLWLLEVDCPGALTVNLTMEQVKLPPGNEMFVYNPSKDFVLGKFTDKHLYEGNLGTELVPGEKVIVEYYQAPENDVISASLEISKVTYGYRGVEEYAQKAFGSAGACHMNVNCPDGSPWSDQKRSTVMIVNSGGNGFCSGALINNTANDGTPYVLTANHCYSNPAAWVIRFNWESPDCSNPATSPAFSSLSGAELKARRTTSDFCLVEITGGLELGTVPAAYNAFFAGWDNSGIVPDSTISIHHPRGDIKKISFDDAPALATQSTVSGVTSDPEGVWMVEWDRNTTTEPVSSGSPLFDQDGRIIGQLWGGGASCSNLTANDFYGRVHTSWEPAGSDQTNQLKFWLDPTNIGALVTDGYDPAQALTQTDATLLFAQDVHGTLCTTSVSPKVMLVNLGVQTMTSAGIQYGYDGLMDQNMPWTGTLEQYESVEISLPTGTLPAGTHDFAASVIAVNGGADDVAGNNLISDSFYIMDNPETVTLNLVLDCYGSETSWELRNEDDDVLFHSPQYVNDTEGPLSYDFCLTEDCYTFSLYDSFGDGMSGCNSGDGSYQIVDASMNVLAELLQTNADFGFELNAQVCIGDAGVSELADDWVSIYPNPFSESIQIESQQIIDKVILLDLSGNVIARLPLGAKQRRLNMETLASGVYFLKIVDINGAGSTQKIVKR